MWFNKEDHQTLSAGAYAEQRAETFLLKQGLITLAKNYRCKQGEIDLIMQHEKALVFVEVRLRTNRHFLSAAESVTLAKQKKIIRAAQQFLQERHLSDKYACRFDVIALNNHQADTIDWIRDAFSV